MMTMEQSIYEVIFAQEMTCPNDPNPHFVVLLAKMAHAAAARALQTHFLFSSFFVRDA
jgi:hypothetical protein